MLTVNHFVKNGLKYPEANRIESLLKGKGLIVEFVGPTGAGKTTNCLCFTELLKKHKLNVYQFRDVKRYLYELKLYVRLYIYLSILLFKAPLFVRYSFVLASNGIFSLNSVYRYFKLCIFNHVLHEFIRVRKADIVLLDQWGIQGLWSATIFKGESHRKLTGKIKRFYFNTDCVIYFDIDEEIACERIQERDLGRSRFDSMDKEKRLLALKKYNHYLNQLFQNSDCKNKLIFSAKRSPAENADDFLHCLKLNALQS